MRQDKKGMGILAQGYVSCSYVWLDWLKVKISQKTQ